MDFTWQKRHKNLHVFLPPLSPHLLILSGIRTQPQQIKQIKNDLPSRGNWRSPKNSNTKLKHPFQTFPVYFILSNFFQSRCSSRLEEVQAPPRETAGQNDWINESAYWLHLLLLVGIFKPFSLLPLLSKIFEVFLKKTGSSTINITLMITESSICHQRLLPFVLQGQPCHICERQSDLSASCLRSDWWSHQKCPPTWHHTNSAPPLP